MRQPGSEWLAQAPQTGRERGRSNVKCPRRGGGNLDPRPAMLLTDSISLENLVHLVGPRHPYIIFKRERGGG